MADVTELGIKVTLENGEVAAQQLDAIAASGDKLEQAQKRLVDATDGLTLSQRALMEQGVSLDRILAAVNGSSEKLGSTSQALTNIYADSRAIVLQHAEALELTGTAYRDNRAMVLQHMQALQMDAAAQAQAVNPYIASRAVVLAHAQALQIDAEMSRVVGSIYNENRAIVLQHMAALETDASAYRYSAAVIAAHVEALQMDAMASTEAAVATGVHGLNLGRVNMELGTATGRILGLNTAMTRFGAMLGGSLGGYAEMIAITAAIVALGLAWEHFTEEAKKAREEQDKLTESLRKWHEEQEAGGKRAQEVAAQQKQLIDDTKTLAELQAKLASPTVNRSESVNTALEQQIAATKAKIAEDQHLLQYGSADALKEQERAFDEQQQQRGRELAALVKYQKDNATLRAQALKQLQIDEALEAQYLKAGNVERAAAYAEMAKSLEDALNPKLKTPGGSGTTKNDTITALDKQLEAMRKVSVEENIANVQREYEIKLVGMVGYVHDLLVAQEKAEIETIKALSTLSGIALEERLKTIQADEDAAIAKAKLVRQLKEEADARTTLNDITKDVTRIGKQNEATGKAEIDAAAKKIKDAQAYQDELEKIARNGIERIVSHGMKSYQDFFNDILKTFSQLMDAMEREAKKHNTTPGKGYEALGIASAGLGGALAGYDIGHSTGSAVLGAAGGALSGFELGNAIVPGIGGVVGALAGFAGGLFGASRAAKEAAAAMDELKKVQLQVTLAQWKASITGLAVDQRLANELDLKYKYLSIRQTIEQVEAGKKNEAQRNADLAEADQLYAEAQKKLTDSTNALTGAMENAVQGYRYQAAIFGAAPVHAAPPAPSAGTGRSVYGGGTTGGSGTGSAGSGTTTDGGGDLTVNLVMKDGTILGGVVLKDFKRRAAQKGLKSTQWSEIQ